LARSAGPLTAPYLKLKAEAHHDLGSTATNDAIIQLVLIALHFLSSDCSTVPLKSRVPGKQYHSYALKTNTSAISRPVNESLFEPAESVISTQWKNRSTLTSGELTKMVYTMATAYSVASDLFDRNNKKGPATYLEQLIGHIFACELGKNPTKNATLPLDKGIKVRMTMDFIFDLGKNRPKVHLPVKSSTRERVVQAWAHQRLLDKAYGDGVYKAILVIHSETKLDLRTLEVVEIAVPDQWLAYQSLLATMERIYYLDPPDRYLALSKKYPIIQLRQFGDFFSECKDLLK